MITTKQRGARFASELIGSEDDTAPCGKKSRRFRKTVISRGVLCGQCCRWYHFSCWHEPTSCEESTNWRSIHLPDLQSRSSGLTQEMQDMVVDDKMGLSSGLNQAMKSMQLEDPLVWNYRSLPDYIPTNPDELKTLNGKTLDGAKLEYTFMKTAHYKKKLFSLPFGKTVKLLLQK